MKKTHQHVFLTVILADSCCRHNDICLHPGAYGPDTAGKHGSAEADTSAADRAR